jgi:hypothetical protein
MPWLERSAIAVGVILLVTLPTALDGWPTTLRGNVSVLLTLCAGLALLWWRSHPRAASVVALGLFLPAFAIDSTSIPDTRSIPSASPSWHWAGPAAPPGWWRSAPRRTSCRCTS